MDHLPVVLSRGPLLDTVCASRGNSRSVCPLGRLLALVSSRGVVVLSLAGGRSTECIVSSDPFISVHWVCPSEIPSECVLDVTQSVTGELVGVGTGGDVTWWKLREYEVGESIFVEDVTIFKSSELTNDLRRCGYGMEVSHVLPVGSSDGSMILLVNSTVLCQLFLDHEFTRLVMGTCMMVEPSLQGMSDSVLPAKVGRVVDVVYSSPLFMQLCHDGTVFIHHVEKGVCVGVVNTLQYCHFISSSHSESEELLSQMSAAEFTHLAVTADHSQLTVTSYTNHVLFVNLPDYFEVFPGHYHPQFISSLSHYQRATSSMKMHLETHSTITEEEEEREIYGKKTHLQSNSGVLDFRGYNVWEQRWKCLSQRVIGFDLGSRQGLSFSGTSACLATPIQGSNQKESGMGSQKEKGSGGVGAAKFQRLTPSHCKFIEKKKAWYEKPSVIAMGQLSFELPYISTTLVHSNSAEESYSPTESESLKNRHEYFTSSILPPAPLDIVPGKKWGVVHMSVLAGKVVVYYGEEKRCELGYLAVNSCPVEAVVVYQTTRMTYSITKCRRSVWVVPPCCPTLPYYLFSSHTMSLAAFALSQEEFVSKVLMYGSAVVAEELCRLNRWDRCSLPINTLETALHLRQLDTVSFFLRSRECETKSHESSSGPVEIPSLPPIPPEQLDTAIGMLVNAIKRNHSRNHTSPFTSCLLIMSLAFLTRLIKGQALREERVAAEGEGGSEEVGQGVEQGEQLLRTESFVSGRYRTVSGASVESVRHDITQPSISLTSLASYIQQLRAYLPKASLIAPEEPVRKDNGVENGEGGVGDSSPPLDAWSPPMLDSGFNNTWKHMDIKEVVKDALLRGCLPLAQAHLLHRNISHDTKTNEVSSAMEETATLSNVLAIGSGFVLEALEKKSVQLASSMLTQMCMDVKCCLRHICFNTIHRELRDFLAVELKSRGWLSERESKSLDYLHILETYYMLQSYDEAKSLYSQYHTRQTAYQSTTLPFVPGVVTRTTSIPPMGDLHLLYPETFGGTHTLVHTETTSLLTSPTSAKGPPLYLQVPLGVVLDWDTAIRQQVLYEVFVLKSQTDGTDCEQFVAKEHVFDYVLRHNDTESALQFIMSRVPPLGSPSLCPAQITSQCSYISQCAGHLKDSILDHLARDGVITQNEAQDLSLLLARLGRIHVLFYHPHPLSKSQEGISPSPTVGVKEEKCIVSLEDFHFTFVQYCISNAFASLLYHYLDCYNLALDEASISSLGLANVEESWVDAILQCRLLAIDSNDPSVMFQTSLACGRLLLQVPGGVVMEMMQCNRILMAIATLMYAPSPLEEALNQSSSDQPWHVDPSVLKTAVAAYPTLQAALFPPSSTSLTAAQSQDITVYQLLQGTVPFDVSRLFKWQTTNTLATMEDSTEGSHVIPHFSQPAMAEKYARVERLSYIHYLCRGQPSFAFANFVTARLLGRSHVTKRVDHAVSRVYRLALHNFTNVRVVSSCAAFIEMLDRDSRLLRIDAQAAARIARYSPLSPSDSERHHGRQKEGTSRESEIASQFAKLNCSSEEKVTSELLQQLEKATAGLVASSSLEKCCLESEEQWSLVQDFCVCHSLLPSTAFLCVCAQEGQWLPLLCHAQLYDIPPQKVLPIIEKYFSSPHIQEHLRLALSSMDPTSTTTLAASQGGGFSQKPRSRRRRTNTWTRLQQEVQQQNLVRTQPDIRAKLYSKIGLQRERSPLPDSTKQEKNTTEQPSHTPITAIHIEENLPALSEEHLPDDLFSVLFKCQSHRCPWRYLLAHAIALQRPLLAIIAACDKDAVMVDCMCVWLYCTLGFEQLSKATVLLGLVDDEEVVGGAQFCSALQWHQWSAQDLALVLAVSLQLPVAHTAPHFTLAFLYFDPNNPLLSLFKFHEQFTLYCNLEECKKHISEFNLAMSKCSPGVGTGYLGEIGDVYWVEKLANMVTSHMLVICPTPFETSHLLRLLNDACFGHSFQCIGLDFNNLYEMSEVLIQAGLPTDAVFTIREHFDTTPGAKSLAEVYTVRVRVDSDRVLGMLIEKAQFSIARRYASLVGSTASEVTVKEAEHNLRKLSESSYWKHEQARLNFWHSCNTSFASENVDAELAAEFFESVVHHSSDAGSLSSSTYSPSSPSSTHSFPPMTCSATERALLLAFALKWRRDTNTMTSDQLKEFEREIWHSHIHASVEDMLKAPGDKTSGSPLPFLPSYSPEDILLSQESSSLLSTLSITVSPSHSGQRNLKELVLPDNVPVLTEASHRRESTGYLTDSEEVKAFNAMLGRLLNAGYVSQARELAALFEHDSPDLTIVLCCIQLAQGKLSTEQLTDEVISLVSTHSPRHLSELSLSFEQHSDSRPSVEIIRMMQKLSDRAKHARECCSCIITCFKIAVCLHVSYNAVVTNDPFSILTQVLSSRFTDRYQLAKKFVSDCNLKSKEVAGYLSDCVVSALQAQIGTDKKERESPRSSVYYVQMTSSQFVELAQLCPDHNEIGSHLLSMAKSLSSSEPLTTQNISVQVELLVRAHDCYTLGCSVDGISEVLLVVRQWVPNLVSLKLFSFMVRLLTGIGRFYEMAYILQILMENDQFESLLHTGLEKEEQLRVALMDYLKTHHPNDSEKMQMVALKFGMFYELAKAKQEQAKRDLKRIKPKHLVSNNAETVKTLKTAFETLRTAANTYAQEDYLSSAQQCFSQARLVALQLSILHESGKQVINLENKRVLKLMEELPFQEALILADAYKRTSWTDWVNPLYKKVVIGGHFRYLVDYKTAFPLKPNMFQELASKYQHDREKPAMSAANMKRLLTNLHNLPLKRKIATDLGLSDVLQKLSPTQDEGFLNEIARL